MKTTKGVALGALTLTRCLLLEVGKVSSIDTANEPADLGTTIVIVAVTKAVAIK